MFREVSIAVALLLAPLSAFAQERKEPLDAVPVVRATRANERIVVREQTVYVPYQQLRKVFEEEGRGIFLPYEKFLELWHAANPPPDVKPPVDPPAAAVIRSSPYVGTVDGELARFDVVYRVEALKDGWSELVVPLSDVAIESVDLGESAAIFLARAPGYALFLPRKGSYELSVRFSIPVASSPGRKSISFGLPPSAVSSVELTIPEADARVDVTPASAATRFSKTDAGATRVVAHVGNADRFGVSWMPPAGNAAEDAAVLIAEQSARVRLDERVLAINSRIDYRLARGEAAQFRVTVPADDATRLLFVKGENIRRWNLTGDVLDVELHSPVKDAYSLALAFERSIADGTTSVAVPLPRMQGVLRETGWLALAHDPALRVTVDSQTGYSQLDPEEVPQGLREDLRVGFQYLTPPAPLVLGVSKIEPVIRSRAVSVVTLGRERDDWAGFVDYTITKAGVFSLALRVPERWSVEEIGDPSTVDDFQSSEVADTLRTITVNLKSRQLGTFRLPFKLTADGSATPGQKTVWPPLVAGTTQDQGLFGVAAPRALDIRSEAVVGMSSVEQAELVQAGILSRISADSGEPQAYSYQKNGAAQRARLDVLLAEKQEEVEVVAQHLVSVADSGRIKITHFLDYEILYKARQTIEFSAPTSLDGTLRVDGEQLSETPQPVPQGDGLSKWTVQLQSAVEGRVPLTITHELAPEALEDGVPRTIDVPFVVPRAGIYERRSGFVALTKSGNLEVRPLPETLEVVDESRLTGKLRGGPVLAAYGYTTKEPKLGLELTRYKPVPLARTAVSLLHVRAVISPKPCKLTAIATLVVQNSAAQHLEIELPPGARTRTVHVAGQPVTTKERKEGTSQLVAIPRSDARESFPVVVVYDQDLADAMGVLGSREIRTLRVLETADAPVPVQKIELDLWVPRDFTYLSFGGNLERRGERETLTSRFAHVFSAAFGEAIDDSPRPQPASVPAIDEQFARTLDGTEFHAFSTMARDGSLRVRWVSPSLFVFAQLVLFLVVAVGGLVAVRKLAWSELWVVVALTCGPLVVAWFLESGSAGIFSAAFYGGVVLGILILVRRIGARVRDWRLERLALAPDPYLEDAASETAPSEAAPSAAAPSEAAPSDSPAAGAASDAPAADGDAPKES